MPWYMDRHDGVDAEPEEIAKGHAEDLAIQHKYGARYVTGWYDKDLARYFCLVEAPSAENASAVHQEAHGEVANEIIQVNLPAVEEFLGKVAETPLAQDPQSLEQIPGMRVILFTDIESSTATMRTLGDDRAMELLRTHNMLVRDALESNAGHEVKHTGDGIMASFISASKSIQAAIQIQRSFLLHDEAHPDSPIRVRIGLTAGEPVLDDDDLFGTAVNLARRVCDHAEPAQILVPDVVRQLVTGKGFTFSDIGEFMPRGFDELVRLYEVGWRKA